MPTDSSNSPAPDQSLSPEQRERNGRSWAWSNRPLRLLLGIVLVFTFAAILLSAYLILLLISFNLETIGRITPAVFGFFIVYASFVLAWLIVLYRNRPANYLTTVRSVRIVVMGGFVVLCAMIGVLLTLVLWSIGIGVGTEAVMLAAFGSFVLAVAFVVMSIIAAFVALIDHGTRQQAEYRATHPRPS